jgi:Lung seven transmembrane receptor
MNGCAHVECGPLHQVKLEMYNKLTNVLVGFIVAWTFLAIVVLLAERAVFHVSWKLSWFINRFWDVLYFILLAMVRGGVQKSLLFHEPQLILMCM